MQVGGTTGLALSVDQECAYGSASPVIMIVIGVVAGLIVLTCLGTVWYYCRKAAAYRQRHPFTDDDQCKRRLIRTVLVCDAIHVVRLLHCKQPKAGRF